MTPGKRDASGPPAPSPTTPTPERRANLNLRELLDEMILLARNVSRNSRGMTSSELTYARERMQWLADEIWDAATKHLS